MNRKPLGAYTKELWTLKPVIVTYSSWFPVEHGKIPVPPTPHRTGTWLSKTSERTSLQGLEEKKQPRLAFITISRSVSSDVKVEVSQAFWALSVKDAAEKEKQPLLNKPLKKCPLYLGFIILIVNPSQASSASHSDNASAAKHAILYKPKPRGWKIPPLDDKHEYCEVISEELLFSKPAPVNSVTLFNNMH